MALTPIGVAVHAATAGWRGTDLVKAVAVSWAESGGNDAKAGGLWALPGEPGGDPAGNAVKAFARQQASGWNQWAAHRTNKYLLFMPVATAAVAAPQVVAIIVKDTAGDIAENLPGADMLDAAKNAVTLGVKASRWLSDRHNWVRIVQVVAGVNLLVVGLVLIARPERAIGAAVGGLVKPIVKGVVGKAATAAKAAPTTKG